MPPTAEMDPSISEDEDGGLPTMFVSKNLQNLSEASTCSTDGEIDHSTGATLAEVMGGSPTSTHVSAEKRAEAIDRIERNAAKFQRELEQRCFAREATPVAWQSCTVDVLPYETGTFKARHLPASTFASAPMPNVATHLLGNEDKTQTVPLQAETGSLVIFDWDDTLFPTWFVTNVVNPCTPSLEDKRWRFPTHSPFHDTLKEHAAIIRNLLTVASSVAHVAIVTLAQRPWVTESARYLPGLDLEKLLADLDIKVYYARESMNNQPSLKRGALIEADWGVDPCVIAKRLAMSKCLRKTYGKNSLRWNVVSVGDTRYEVEAAKEALWFSDRPGKMTLCKTVKFMEEPNCEELGHQLQLLAASLQSIIARDDDLDLTMYSGWDEAARVARRQQSEEEAFAGLWTSKPDFTAELREVDLRGRLGVSFRP